jgi:hypothetical protein
MWVADKNDKQAQYAQMLKWNPNFLKNEENFHFTMSNYGIPYDAAVHMWATAPRDENGVPIISMTPEQIKFEGQKYTYKETKKMLLANGHPEPEAVAMAEKIAYNTDPMDQAVFWNNHLAKLAADGKVGTEEYRIAEQRVKQIMSATVGIRGQWYAESWAKMKGEVRRILTNNPGAYQEYEMAWLMAAQTGQEPKIPQGMTYEQRAALEEIRRTHSSSSGGTGKGKSEENQGAKSKRELLRREIAGGGISEGANNTIEAFQTRLNARDKKGHFTDIDAHNEYRDMVRQDQTQWIVAAGVNPSNDAAMDIWIGLYEHFGDNMWKFERAVLDKDGKFLGLERPNLKYFRSLVEKLPSSEESPTIIQNPEMYRVNR